MHQKLLSYIASKLIRLISTLSQTCVLSLFYTFDVHDAGALFMTLTFWHSLIHFEIVVLSTKIILLLLNCCLWSSILWKGITFIWILSNRFINWMYSKRWIRFFFIFTLDRYWLLILWSYALFRIIDFDAELLFEHVEVTWFVSAINIFRYLLLSFGSIWTLSSSIVHRKLLVRSHSFIGSIDFKIFTQSWNVLFDIWVDVWSHRDFRLAFILLSPRIEVWWRLVITC